MPVSRERRVFYSQGAKEEYSYCSALSPGHLPQYIPVLLCQKEKKDPIILGWEKHHGHIRLKGDAREVYFGAERDREQGEEYAIFPGREEERKKHVYIGERGREKERKRERNIRHDYSPGEKERKKRKEETYTA
jgi:hypothetical protein